MVDRWTGLAMRMASDPGPHNPDVDVAGPGPGLGRWPGRGLGRGLGRPAL